MIRIVVVPPRSSIMVSEFSCFPFCFVSWCFSTIKGLLHGFAHSIGKLQALTSKSIHSFNLIYIFPPEDSTDVLLD